MTDEMKRTLDALNRAFEEFKASNDQRLTELAAQGSASADVVAKVEASNQAITDLTAKVQALKAEHEKAAKQVYDLETAMARPRSPEAQAAVEQERREAVLFLATARKRQPREVAAALTEGDVQVYRDYRAAFSEYLTAGRDGMSADRVRALSVGGDPSGGYFAPPSLTGRVVEFLRESSPMRQLAQVDTIGLEALEGYTDLGEADSGWVGETATRSASDAPEVGKWRIPLEEQYAMPRSTQKLLDMAINDPEAWLARKVADRLSRTENTAFVAGDGVAKPRGFITYAHASAPGSTAATWKRIQYNKTGADGAFAAAPAGGDVFIDAIHGIKAPLRQDAVFLMARMTLAAARKLKDSDGAYLWLPDFSGPFSGRLLGYGVVEAADMPAYNVADADAIAFGNFRAGYQIVDHGTGVRVLRDNLTQKPWVLFYTTKYTGGDVVNFEAIDLIRFGN